MAALIATYRNLGISGSPGARRHCITYYSAVKSHFLHSPPPPRKRNNIKFVLSPTPIALLRDRHASPPLFPHPLLAHLLERAVNAVEDVPPLAFPSGAWVEAWVITLAGPLPSGRCWELSWCGTAWNFVRGNIRCARFRGRETGTLWRGGYRTWGKGGSCVKVGATHLTTGLGEQEGLFNH
jgi:hypothetical protein